MSKLAGLLKKKKPFITHFFLGVGGCLTSEDGEPLAVDFHPPRMSVLTKRKEFTNLIGRHTDVLSQTINQAQNLGKQGLQDEARRQGLEKIAKMSLQSKMDELAEQVEFGKFMLTEFAFQCYHSLPEDSEEEIVKYKLSFVSTDEKADELNSQIEENKNEIFLSFERFGDDELTELSELIVGDSKDTVANIPIKDSPNDKEDEGVSSIPSDELGHFPSNLGQVPVETRTGNEK